MVFAQVYKIVMFVRETHSKRKDGSTVTYLHLVESQWDKRKKGPRHKVLHSFGRKDQLDVEQIRRLVHSLRQYLEPSDAVDTRSEFKRFLGAKDLGLPYMLDQLWHQLRIDRFFRHALTSRQFEAPIERALFAMVAQRVCAPGSKLSCEHWVGERAFVKDLPQIPVHQLYRAMDFLYEHGQQLETDLHFQINELLDLDLSVVFYDTTALYFSIEQPDKDGLRRRGHCKKDNPNHLPQVVVGLAINKRGIPIRHWVWPGNMSDVATVTQVIRDLKGLRPRRFFFIGDRGMVSQTNVDYLESRQLKFILGVKLRKNPNAEVMLSIRGRYRKVEEHLFLKEKRLLDGDREMRYILVRNAKSAQRDRNRREDILAFLRKELERPRAPEEGTVWSQRMRTHRVFGRFLCAGSGGRLAIDIDAVKAEERLDGKYILMTNDLETDAHVIVAGYRELYTIEHTFESMKGALDTRPMFHRLEDRIRAHIQLCVLAYTLMKVAMLRSGETWTQIERTLSPLKVGELAFADGIVFHRSELNEAMRTLYNKVEVPVPPGVLSLST